MHYSCNHPLVPSTTFAGDDADTAVGATIGSAIDLPPVPTIEVGTDAIARRRRGVTWGARDRNRYQVALAAAARCEGVVGAHVPLRAATVIVPIQHGLATPELVRGSSEAQRGVGVPVGVTSTWAVITGSTVRRHAVECPTMRGLRAAADRVAVVKANRQRTQLHQSPTRPEIDLIYAMRMTREMAEVIRIIGEHTARQRLSARRTDILSGLPFHPNDSHRWWCLGRMAERDHVVELPGGSRAECSSTVFEKRQQLVGAAKVARCGPP
eukprot:SAG11_NODE_3696_length_2274_cov_4.078621_1_plen_268_part_00